MEERLEDLYSERVIDEIKKYVIELNKHYESKKVNGVSTREVIDLYLNKDIADAINEFDVGRFEEARTLISEFYEILSMMGTVEEAIEVAKTIKQCSYDKNAASKLSVYLMWLSQTDDKLFKNALEIYSDELVIDALKKYDSEAREFFTFEVYNSLIETGSPKFAKKLKRLMLVYSDKPLYGYPIMMKYSSVFEATVLRHKSPKQRNGLRGDITYNNVSNKEWKVIGYLGEVLISKHDNPKRALEIVTKVYEYVLKNGFVWHKVKRIINREVAKE